MLSRGRLPPDLDVILLEGLELECIVGVYPSERTTPQPLRVDVALGFNARGAAHSGQLSDTVDYATLVRQVEFVVRHARFGLLETAAEALAQLLMVPPPLAPGSVREVELALSKPRALAHGAPTVVLRRRLADAAASSHEYPEGIEQRLFDGPVRLDRWLLRAGKELGPARSVGPGGALFALGAGLERDGTVVPPFTPQQRAPDGSPWVLRNASTTDVVFLVLEPTP